MDEHQSEGAEWPITSPGNSMYPSLFSVMNLPWTSQHKVTKALSSDPRTLFVPTLLNVLRTTK